MKSFDGLGCPTPEHSRFIKRRREQLGQGVYKKQLASLGDKQDKKGRKRGRAGMKRYNDFKAF